MNTTKKEKSEEKGSSGLWGAAWRVSALLLIVLIAFPINRGVFRCAVIGLVAVVWLGGIILTWRRRWISLVILGLGAAVILFVLTPGGAYDPNDLREEYVRSLSRFEGARYCWGGENRLGIDCSGLVRWGLINACLREGVTTGRPILVRRAIFLWWNDCSADALKNGCYDTTRYINTEKSVNDIDTTHILPGDCAVTVDGVHVMAYLGDGEWIEADPDLHRVYRTRVPDTGNRWFSLPVTVVRWSLLDTSAD